ncbi:MAG: hypothetical protein ACKORY_11500 [Actinomycetota bacterium]
MPRNSASARGHRMRSEWLIPEGNVTRYVRAAMSRKWCRVSSTFLYVSRSCRRTFSCSSSSDRVKRSRRPPRTVRAFSP